jgi:hypothetical protein
MQIVVQVHSLNLPYFHFCYVSCLFLHSNVLLYYYEPFYYLT